METYMLLLITMLWTKINTLLVDDIEIEIPKECRKKGICAIQPVNYKKIEDKMYDALPKFLIEEYASDLRSAARPFRNLMVQRDLWNECKMINKTEHAYLYVHNKKKGIADIIVQLNVFKQRISSLQCRRMQSQTRGDIISEKCFEGSILSGLGVKSYCENIYSTITIYIFDYKTQKVRPKDFEIPTNCECMFPKYFQSKKNLTHYNNLI